MTPDKKNPKKKEETDIRRAPNIYLGKTYFIINNIIHIANNLIWDMNNQIQLCKMNRELMHHLIIM